MAGFLSKAASYTGLGALSGAYLTNKGFRNNANKFLFGNESEMQPYNQESLQSLLQMLQGGGLEGNSLYGAGSSYLQNLLQGGQGAFDAFEAPYMQNFQQNIVPGIAERFAGAGTGAGAGSSSALNNSLAQAGRNLQTDLAGLRSNLQMQAIPQSLAYAQQPISNQFNAAQSIPNQYYDKPGQEGLLQELLKAFAQGAGKTIGGRF